MEKIYSRYSRTVYAYLLRLCNNVELAHELTQETFYQAVRSIQRFDGKSNVSTWLCSIARHLYYDALRRQRPFEELPEQIPSPGDFTEQIICKDQAMIAHHRLHMLEEPYREVFTLRTFCDLSHIQIAELFGKSESWSRVTYYRARRMLQDAMKENDDEKERL
ncbi:MAG: sigma-70 family RNA polymerase sigma factor [Firmicutes bacterium]|nr:sigma-70 family RNA polymerase sigma factor [Bacillota bacterium]